MYNKGAESLRIQGEQGFIEYISANICILNVRSAFGGLLDLEQKSSADNQVKRICACTSERTKIAIRQLTSGEFMQSIKDEIFVSNYSTNDNRTKVR